VFAARSDWESMIPVEAIGSRLWASRSASWNRSAVPSVFQRTQCQ
jgi:hypothetical protein